MIARVLVLFGMGLVAACVAPAQTNRKVDDAALRAAAPEEWLTSGRDYQEQHYSPLDQINARNISRLGLAWTYDTESAPGRLEAVPLISNGVMYGSQTWSVIFAIDARTGVIKWKFDPEISRQSFPANTDGADRIRTGPSVCCDAVNRGVALYGGKVLAGLLDGSLVALDAETGKVVWRVQTTPKNEDYSITGAPRVVKGKVIIGNAGADFGVRGFVSAYDAETGYEAWRFYTVPGNPSKGFESKAMAMAATTWTGEWWKLGGGGTVWDGMAYDPEADLLYIGTGNGAPWNRKVRSPQGGDNLFLSSIVALKPDTGEYVWHYQTTPGDTWDYTATQPLMLADLTIGGRLRKVIMQAPKNGFFYVIDRLTGEFISGEPYAKHITWATGIDAVGRPIEAPGARYEKEGFLIAPAADGAHNWQAMSFNPATQLVYVPGREGSTFFRSADTFDYLPGRHNTGATFGPPPGTDIPSPTLRQGWAPTAAPAPAPSREFLVAYDPVAARERWRVSFQGLFTGGTLSTAGNIVFTGSGDDLLAFRADNGEKLWEVRLASGLAQPVTYALDGTQYVSVLAGRDAGRMYTFVLDGKLPMPPPSGTK